MNKEQFNKRICDAIDGAFASRGKNKGYLKARCPEMGTDAAAAWQAIMGSANPYRVGLAHMLFMDQEVHDNVYRPICDMIHAMNIDCRPMVKNNILSILN